MMYFVAKLWSVMKGKKRREKTRMYIWQHMEKQRDPTGWGRLEDADVDIYVWICHCLGSDLCHNKWDMSHKWTKMSDLGHFRLQYEHSQREKDVIKDARPGLKVFQGECKARVKRETKDQFNVCLCFKKMSRLLSPGQGLWSHSLDPATWRLINRLKSSQRANQLQQGATRSRYWSFIMFLLGEWSCFCHHSSGVTKMHFRWGLVVWRPISVRVYWHECYGNNFSQLYVTRRDIGGHMISLLLTRWY